MAEEKFLTINLRKKLTKKPKWKRSKSAVLILRDILKSQMKTEKIKIDKKLNEKIWERGSKKPLTKFRVKLKKLDDGTIEVGAT